MVFSWFYPFARKSHVKGASNKTVSNDGCQTKLVRHVRCLFARRTSIQPSNHPQTVLENIGAHWSLLGQNWSRDPPVTAPDAAMRMLHHKPNPHSEALCRIPISTPAPHEHLPSNLSSSMPSSCHRFHLPRPDAFLFAIDQCAPR